MAAHGQNDGDHTLTNGSGQTYLSNDALVGGGTVAPDGFTVGTTPSGAGALTVYGGQMANPTGVTFSTYTGNNVVHSWKMNKGSSPEWIGHIFNPSSASDKTFNLDARSDNLQFLTNQVLRAALHFRVANATINSQAPFNQSGYFSLSGAPGFISNGASPGPFSRFHLVDGNSGNIGTFAPTLGFRGWMRNGVTFTGNTDQMYIGHKYITDGSGTQQNTKSQAVFQWSEGTLDDDRQALKFIFTTTPGSSTVGSATSPDGMEIMRLWPESNTLGYVGIGDFSTPALAADQKPSERLDLLDRTIRLRGFMSGATPSYQDNSLDQVLVVDPTDGRVHWRAASTLGAPGCQWSMPSSTPNHVSTAFGTASSACPDDAEAVGIGVDLGSNAPLGKLDLLNSQYRIGQSLRHSTATVNPIGLDLIASGGSGLSRGIQISTSSTSGSTRGIDITSTQNTGCVDNRGLSIASNSSGALCAWGNYNYGLRADVNGASWYTRGVSAETNGGTGGWSEYGGEFLSYGNAAYTWGVYGFVNSGAAVSIAVEGDNDSNAPVNIGVIGSVAAVGTNNYYGVYGSAPTAPANSWAVYSNGNQYSSTFGTWTTSDEQLKENVENISGGLDRILQVQPKSFTFSQDEAYTGLNLSTGQQFGVIAQEIQSVLPELVRNVHVPAELDSLGAQVHPAMDLLAVNYEQLIPIMISAIREQNGVIAGMQEQLAYNADQSRRTDDLQQQLDEVRVLLSTCCATGESDGEVIQLGTSKESIVIGDERKLNIQPNPFTERTTLNYSLDQSCRMQLIANSADGKELRVLEEGSKIAGQYQLVWDTASFAPGIYYVTLLMDGEQIVKRAVKVGQ